MSSNNPSLEAIVQQVIETISDAVSQLVLLVIALEEQNADVPPQLPQAVQGVAQSGGKLVVVAKSLADEDYEAFPDIAKQITDAANAVQGSVDGLVEAVKNLTSETNRSKGWRGLADACKVIGGKTILLLQIVYGASLLRIYEQANRALSKLDSLNPSTAKSTPQAFANDLSAAATEANQLAQYVRERAEDTELPLLKRELNELADQLSNDAHQLINNGNELLQNPDDPEKARKLQDGIEQVKARVNEAQAKVRDNEIRMAPKTSASVSEAGYELKTPHRFPDEVALYTMRTKQKPFGKETLRSGFGAAELEQAPRSRALTQEKRTPSCAFLEKDVMLNSMRGRDALDQLVECARAGDGKGQRLATQDLESSLKPLLTQSREVAALTDDPQKKQALLAGVSELEQLIPAATKAGNQNSAETERMRSNVMEPLATIEAAITRENGPAQALQRLERAAPVLVQCAEMAAAAPTDLSRERKAQDALDELESAMRAAPLDPEAQLAATARQEKRDIAELNEAAVAADPKAVLPAAKQLSNTNQRLADQARAIAANTADPEKKRELEQAADSLEKQLPVAIQAAKNLLEHPSTQNQRELQKVSDDVRDIADQLASAVRPPLESEVQENAQQEKVLLAELPVVASRGDRQKLGEHLNELDKTFRDLLDDTRMLADGLPESSRKRDIQAAADDLENTMAVIPIAARRAADSPQDKESQNKLKELTAQADRQLDTLAQATRANPVAAAQKEEHALTRLTNAVKENPEDVSAAARALVDAQKDLKEQAQREADSMDDPVRKRQLLDAMNDLESRLPTQIKAAKESLQNPNDETRAALEDSKALMRAPLAKVQQAINPTKEHALEADARSTQAAAAQLRSDVRNQQDIDNAAARLQEEGQNLLASARKEAADMDDPATKRVLLDAADDVEAKLAAIVPIARKAANSNDPESKVQLDAAVSDLNQPIDEMIAAVQLKDEDKAADSLVAAQCALAALGPKRGRGDPRSLFEAAQQMANDLNNLLGHTKARAKKLQPSSSSKAASALALDSMLSELEVSSKPVPRARLPAAVTVPTEKRRPRPKTYHEAIQYVAEDIQDACRGPQALKLAQGDSTINSSHAIAEELNKLAVAAKDHQRNDILICGRSIAAHVSALCSDTKGIADRCTDAVLKDKLLGNIQAMKNYSIQLKILTAVKAASTEGDSAAEDQLVSMTRALGDTLTNIIDSVAIIKCTRSLN